MAQTESHLRTQLQVYTDKYAEFEATLNKSNEVFTAFKLEMEKVILGRCRFARALSECAVV